MYFNWNPQYACIDSPNVGGVKYVLSDWQGSVRASVSNSGFVRSRTDYQAFGEEINAGTGLRTAAQGFGGGVSTRQGYGLTEKDDSTGLNHTWFRKNESRAGRWTSPDPYNGSASLGNPQSFNRFSYVENQPTNFVDPSGLQIASVCQWVRYAAVIYTDDDGITTYIPARWNYECITLFVSNPTPLLTIQDVGGGPNNTVRAEATISKAKAPTKREDRCGNTTDLNVSVGPYQFGLQIGKHYTNVYGGIQGGTNLPSGSITTNNSRPSEGVFVTGSAGVFPLGGNVSVPLTGTNEITTSVGAASPHASVGLIRSARLLNHPSGKKDCQ
ncbi:MAG: hypothetical protein KIS76_16190 [Pyrinomonadaceae bacterium]|nr:hypothetical protein [Pyrinomonadaceae bacterium]